MKPLNGTNQFPKRIYLPFLILLVLTCCAAMAFGQATTYGGVGEVNIAADTDNTGDGDIQFKAGPDIRMIMKDDGKVGIGTTNPTSELSVEGNIRIKNDHRLNSEVIIRFQADTDNSGDGIFHWMCGPLYKMSLIDNGNLGLGTANPQATLHVKGDGSSGTIRISPEADDEESSIGFYQNADGSTGNYWLTGQGSWGNTGDYVIGNGGADVVIEADGNFGIGTNAPLARLHVNGKARFSGELLPNSDNTYAVGSSSLRWDRVFAANGIFNTSDRREKENIEEIQYGLKEILALNPVSYTWIDRPDQGKQVGLIAQDANEIVPEVVFDPAEQTVLDEAGNWVPAEVSEEDRFGINYALLTPVLIRAIQEQQATIEALETKLEALAQGDANPESTMGLRGASSPTLDLPKLYPNVPNPFGESTEIRVYLPETVEKATLHIFDLQGNLLRDMNITDRGNAGIVINGQEMMPGMFIYSLVADGKEIDSRRMILTK